MIALLLCWFVLGLASWQMGIWISRATGGEDPRRTSSADTRIQTLFVGLMALASLALLFSIFVPARTFLWPLIGLAVLGLRAAPQRPSPFFLWPVLLAGLVSLGLISSRDSMTYHHDLIHLLARGGIPPGLAWIHERFGFQSSWFALHAAFDQEAVGLAGRMDTLGNGALLALALCHLGVSARRWLGGTADLATRFAALAWLLVLPLPVYLNYANSPTPDFPVIVCTMVLAWMLLREGEGVDRTAQARLALLLGGFAFALKLSAAPLALAAAFACLRREGLSRRLVATGVLAALPVVVSLAAVWLASGYPLFPAAWTPVPVEWQVPVSVAEIEKATVHGFAYWGQATRPDHLAGVEIFSLPWLRHWLFADPVNTLGGIAFALSLLVLPPILRRGELRRGLAPLLPLALVGTIYLVLLAPAPRFGLGFLLALPVAWLAWRLPARLRCPPHAVSAVLLLLMLGVVSSTWIRSTRSERRIEKALRNGVIRLEPQAPWLRPPLIPHLHYDAVSDIAFLPDPERSHNAPGTVRNVRATWYLPQAVPGGRPRDPARGWRGGFVAAEAGQP